MTNIEYNSVFVIIDKLIKYKYFILYKEVSSSEELIYAFSRIIVANYRLPDEIVLDRGITFAFKF
jgi:hypothetical protein